jgi:hypothetical protein
MMVLNGQTQMIRASSQETRHPDTCEPSSKSDVPDLKQQATTVESNCAEGRK